MLANRSNNVERSGQTDPTMLGYTLAIMEQKECWELFQTLRSNSQKHTTTCNRCAKGRNRSHPTMLGVVGQQSYIRLHRAVDMAMEVSSHYVIIQSPSLTLLLSNVKKQQQYCKSKMLSLHTQYMLHEEKSSSLKQTSAKICYVE